MALQMCSATQHPCLGPSSSSYQTTCCSHAAAARVTGMLDASHPAPRTRRATPAPHTIQQQLHRARTRLPLSAQRFLPHAAGGRGAGSSSSLSPGSPYSHMPAWALRASSCWSYSLPMAALSAGSRTWRQHRGTAQHQVLSTYITHFGRCCLAQAMTQ